MSEPKAAGETVKQSMPCGVFRCVFCDQPCYDCGWLKPFHTALEQEAQRRHLEVLSAVRDTHAVQWQQIETAPRDGTILLLLEPSYRNTIYGEISPGYWEPHKAYTAGGHWTDDVHTIHATHWMPLPDPPVARASSGSRASEKET